MSGDRTKERERAQQQIPPQAQAVATTQPPRIPYRPAAHQYGISSDQWETLINAIFPSAKTADGVMLAIAYCKSRNLDIFKRVVHIVPMSTKIGNTWKTIETIWPGINELRTTAFRTGKYAGCDPAVFGPDIETTWEHAARNSNDDDDGHPNAPPNDGPKKAEPPKIKITVKHPEWCQITVYRLVDGQRVAFPGPRVYWLEAYATMSRFNDAPNEMWRGRVRGQIEKCFDPETEILTDAGFQKFPDVTGRILQVTHNGISAVDAKPFRQAYKGPMICVDGEALNFMVTPNHDMVTDKGMIPAKQLFDESISAPRFRIIATAPLCKTDADISDRAIILAAAFLADGSCGERKSSMIFRVSRPHKIQLLESLSPASIIIESTVGKIAVASNGRKIQTQSDTSRFRFPLADLEGLADQWKRINTEILLNLSARQAQLFIDTIVRMDGHTEKSGVRRFWSTSPQIMSAVEIAAIIAGKNVSERISQCSDIGKKIAYRITIGQKDSFPALRHVEKRIRQFISNGAINPSMYVRDDNPSGDVWCVRVPSGVIVVRRHGFSMLCGNCTEAASLRKAFPEELGGEYTIDEAPRIVDITPPAGEGQKDIPATRPEKPSGASTAAADTKIARAARERQAAMDVDHDPQTGEIKQKEDSPTGSGPPELSEALESALGVLSRTHDEEEIKGMLAGAKADLTPNDFAVFNTAALSSLQRLAKQRQRK